MKELEQYSTFRLRRYRLEKFMFPYGKVGLRLTLWLSLFWLRFLYELGPNRRLKLSMGQHHPLINDLDGNLMDVGGGVDGEYSRLVSQMRNYLNAQYERSHLLPEEQFPRPRLFDKVYAFLRAFLPSRVPSPWKFNTYSDVDY